MFARSSRERHAWFVRRARLAPVVGSTFSVALVTAAVFGLRTAVPVLSLGVLYLFAVLPVALLWGRAWGVVVAVASMLAFNWFFLPPRHTFQLAERSNWLALAVYVVTALVVSDRASQARNRLRRLSSASDSTQAAQAAIREPSRA
jgi:two-component system, OmpR family, sensor histidine kinase KdpD